MGFGFNLLCAFVIFPLSILLLFLRLVSRKQIWGKILFFIWLPIFALVVLGRIVRFFTEKKQLERQDIYGKYIIDRAMFPGKQANWQYNHYRFEITKNDDFIFYVTEGKRILKIYKGKVDFLNNYDRPRIRLNIPNPNKHHVIDSEPTLYRRTFSFYYVFYSSKFKNMFFTKGDWKKLSE